MKYNSKKHLVVSLAIICIVALVALFMIRKQKTELSFKITPSYTPSPTSSPSQHSPRQDEWTKTAIYHNEKYAYSLLYPSLYLMVFTKTPEKVSFEDTDTQFLGRVFISIEPKTYSSPDEWLKEINSPSSESSIAGEHFILEKRVQISGHDAIVAYPASVYEDYPDDKSIILIKDHNLFKINVHRSDLDWVLKNFKFD